MNDRFHKGTDLGSTPKKAVPTPSPRKNPRDVNYENRHTVENDEGGTKPMKRRTFLWLVPAALSIPILLELIRHKDSNSAALGVTSSISESVSKIPASIDSRSDSEANTDNGFGLTLEEAKTYSSSTNCPYFIHRSNTLFYPVAVTLESDSKSVTFLDYNKLVTYSECLNLCLSNGDELVYISSSGSAPDTVSLYPIDEIGNTIPVTLDVDSDGNPRLVSLKRYGYSPDISRQSIDDIPHHAGKRDRQDEYYFWIPFSEYDPENATDSTMLSSSKSHVSLSGDSLEDILSKYMGYDNLFPIAELTSITDVVVEKEYLLRNYWNLMPEDPLNLTKLYNYGQESPEKIEWYSGTEYQSCTLNPSCAYFVYDKSASNSCAISLTPNGYATVDLSSLTNLPYSYILDCKEEIGTPHHAYIYIRP